MTAHILDFPAMPSDLETARLVLMRPHEHGHDELKAAAQRMMRSGDTADYLRAEQLLRVIEAEEEAAAIEAHEAPGPAAAPPPTAQDFTFAQYLILFFAAGILTLAVANTALVLLLRYLGPI